MGGIDVVLEFLKKVDRLEEIMGKWNTKKRGTLLVVWIEATQSSLLLIVAAFLTSLCVFLLGIANFLASYCSYTFDHH